MSRNIVLIKKNSGRPILAGNYRVIPVSQAVIIQTPWQTNGLVWNRPIAIGIEKPGEEIQILPIYDHTREVQILILGAGLLGSALIWLLFRKKVHSSIQESK